MHEMELPLVGFTVLSQLAAGLALMVALFDRGDRLAPWQRYSVFTALGAALLGLVFSFLHLGRPLAAIYAVLGAGRSWMSNEIVLNGLFLAALAAWAFACQKESARRRVCGWVAAALGILLVGAQVMVYLLPSRPNWYGALTPLTFLATVVLLGSLAAMAISAITGTEPSAAAWRAAGLGTVLALASMAGAWFLRSNGLSGVLAWLGLSLLLPLALLAMRNRVAGKLLPGLALLLAVAGEAVGRVLFYTSGGQLTLGF